MPRLCRRFRRFFPCAALAVLFLAGSTVRGETSDTLQLRDIKARSKPVRVGNPLYTSRPLLAVGWLKSFDRATSTVVVTIDRERCEIPNILRHRAAKAGKLDEILSREFPEERAFTVHRLTRYFDARPSVSGMAAPAAAQTQGHDPQAITLDSFKTGEWIGVYFRMSPEADQAVSVVSMSKLDPQAEGYALDFNPLGRRVTELRSSSRSDDRITTSTSAPVGIPPRKSE